MKRRCMSEQFRHHAGKHQSDVRRHALTGRASCVVDRRTAVSLRRPMLIVVCTGPLFTWREMQKRCAGMRRHEIADVICETKTIMRKQLMRRNATGVLVCVTERRRQTDRRKQTTCTLLSCASVIGGDTT